MKVLLLGPKNGRLASIVEKSGDAAVSFEAELNPSSAAALGCEFLVSYRYRHVLKSDVLDLFQRRAINLHASYLPWNRGADPNFWSFVNDTPKGVTIHFMDKRVDAGDILVQRQLTFGNHETLHSTYEQLQEALLQIFEENWEKIRDGSLRGYAQPPGGSHHRKKDLEPMRVLLGDKGWQTPVADIASHAKALAGGKGSGE